MSNNEGGGGTQHITEQIDIYKKHLTSFAKTYYKFSSELPHFMFKNKIVQADILNDLYEQSSLLQGLLREIIDDDINGETLRPIHYSCEHAHYHHDQEEEDDDEEKEDW